MSGLATAEEKNEEEDDNDDDKVIVNRSACVWLSHGRGERGRRRQGDGKETGLCLA